ncbi:MAG TPA: DUF4232 domain-containing protein [Actinocrinis sp.]
MITTRVLQPRAQRFAAACTVTAAALVGAAACAAPAHNSGSASSGTHNNAAYAPPASGSKAPTASASATQSPAAPATTAPGTNAAQPQNSAPAAKADPSCRNADIQVGSGYGTQSFPQQWGAIVFKNVGDHTCTLQGFPGAAIEVDGTVINAARVLDVEQDGNAPSSPPLVVIAPGSTAYALMYWVAADVNAALANCYPDGSGTILTTPPNTTETVTFSTGAHVGASGICGGFEVGPVEPGNWGVPIDTPVGS